MRIVNCFPYFNERELLELRLHLLKDVVDHFYICEANRTHAGEPKEFTAAAIIHELGFSDKVTVIRVDLPSKEEEPNNWVRENKQRDAAASILGDDTVAFITDCDEIMDPQYVKWYAKTASDNPTKILHIPMPLLFCRGDLEVTDKNGTPRVWNAAFLCMKAHTDTYRLSILREAYTRAVPKIAYETIFLTNEGSTFHSGWHFSWMGDSVRRLKKWNSYAENAYSESTLETHRYINESLTARMSEYTPGIATTDPLGRDDHKLSFYHWNKLPKMIFELPLVKSYLLPGKIAHNYFSRDMGENWFTFPNLYRSMVERFSSGAQFVEIGVWKGRSASFMATEIANSGKDIKFYCVDHWEGSSEHQNNPELKSLYDIYSNNMKHAKGYYNDMRMSSLEAAQLFADESLDFVFIDASHEYEEVLKDIAAWLPKVKKTGVISGHDCYPHNPDFGGVYKAVSETFINYQVAEDCWMVEKNTMILKSPTTTY